jgi:hypothetical protein
MENKDKSNATNSPVKQRENRSDSHYQQREIEDVDGRGKHPNSQANLKPYPKGVSGNPEGRKGAYEVLTDALNELGDEMTYTKDYDSLDWATIEDGTNREKVLETIWSKAKGGDLKFIEILAKLGCLTPPE